MRRGLIAMLLIPALLPGSGRAGAQEEDEEIEIPALREVGSGLPGVGWDEPEVQARVYNLKRLQVVEADAILSHLVVQTHTQYSTYTGTQRYTSLRLQEKRLGFSIMRGDGMVILRDPTTGRPLPRDIEEAHRLVEQHNLALASRIGIEPAVRLELDAVAIPHWVETLDTCPEPALLLQKPRRQVLTFLATDGRRAATRAALMKKEAPPSDEPVIRFGDDDGEAFLAGLPHWSACWTRVPTGPR